MAFCPVPVPAKDHGRATAPVLISDPVKVGNSFITVVGKPEAVSIDLATGEPWGFSAGYTSIQPVQLIVQTGSETRSECLLPGSFGAETLGGFASLTGILLECASSSLGEGIGSFMSHHPDLRRVLREKGFYFFSGCWFGAIFLCLVFYQRVFAGARVMRMNFLRSCATGITLGICLAFCSFLLGKSGFGIPLFAPLAGIVFFLTPIALGTVSVAVARLVSGSGHQAFAFLALCLGFPLSTALLLVPPTGPALLLVLFLLGLGGFTGAGFDQFDPKTSSTE